MPTFAPPSSWREGVDRAIRATTRRRPAAPDDVLFAPAPVTGSRTGSPDSRGAIGEFAVNPWQNMRFALQYLAYNRFNGASNDYDGDQSQGS
jgi:hypothetical protein